MLGKLLLLIYNSYLRARGAGIAIEAQFESEPLFPHGLAGVFISGGAVVGKDAIIFQQVTIGSNGLIDSSGLGSPTIGDNCLLGAGAKIIGKVRIGNNVRVGANAVVVRDVPDNCVVGSGEQRHRQRDRLVNKLYSWHGRWVYYLNGRWHEEWDAGNLSRLNAEFGERL